jgi:Bacterial PH domain
MALDDRAGLTATDVHRWIRGLQLFHAARFAVMAAVVGATIVSDLVQSGCTPENPCGPSPQGTWWLALLFASLVWLMFAPGLGCLSAFALGILGAGYDPAISARGWWAAEAALSAAALVFLLLIRVHQYRVAATIARRITLPGDRAAGTSVPWGGLWAQFIINEGNPGVFISFAAATGIVLLIFYQHYQPDDQTPGLTFASQLGLVGGPGDQTPWLSFAILAWLLAAAATLRPARVWWAHRRPVDGDLRGILVSTRWPALDNGKISAADGSGLRLAVLRSPVPARDKDWTQPELAMLKGQLWYGGVVQTYALDGEALADAILGLPQLTLLHSWHAPPPASTVEDENSTSEGDQQTADPAPMVADSRAPMVADGDGPPVALALTPFTAYDENISRMKRWILGSVTALLVVGTLAGAVASELSDEPGLWGGFVPGLFLLCVAPLMPHYLRAHISVNVDGVTVVNSMSRHQIPWSAIDRVDLRPAHGLWQWWGSGREDFQLRFSTPYGVFRAEAPVDPDSTGEMAVLLNRILDYRDRTRVTDGHQPTP